jgi:hypothetical protein
MDIETKGVPCVGPICQFIVNGVLRRYAWDADPLEGHLHFNKADLTCTLATKDHRDLRTGLVVLSYCL